MRVSQSRKFSLSNDRAAALELLRLQEAAQLANDRLAFSRGFERNDKISHIVHAIFNFFQFLTALTDEIFHHVHHAINRKMRETNPIIPDMPEERNPIFFVYPICMGISLILCILWLTTQFLNRRPIIALIGNGLGGILIMIGGISAMQHAEKHINLNEISDEELLTHPIFLHNFIMCIVSICGMILYCVPTWILHDVYKWVKELNKNEILDIRRRQERITHCRCQHSKRNYNSTRKSRASMKPNISSVKRQMPELRSSLMAQEKNEKNVQNEPIILYCCCVDLYRYLKFSKNTDNFAHEFQVIQVM